MRGGVVGWEQVDFGMHDASRRGHSSHHVESRLCEDLGALSIDQDKSDRGLGEFRPKLNVEHEKASILGTSVNAVVLGSTSPLSTV